jgi:hypothetical protein
MAIPQALSESRRTERMKMALYPPDRVFLAASDFFLRQIYAGNGPVFDIYFQRNICAPALRAAPIVTGVRNKSIDSEPAISRHIHRPSMQTISLRPRFVTISVLGIAALGCTGCYDAHALVDQVRTDALRNRLHEVDLGTFRTTMPRDPKSNLLMEMELHLFGTVPQYKIRSIEERLEADNYRLRYETLAAIRETNGDELTEPDLTHLRGRLTQVVNNILTDSPLKSVGIQDIKIVCE